MAARNVTLTRRPRSPVARPIIQVLDVWTVVRLAIVLGITITTTAGWQWKLCRGFAFISLMSRRARGGMAAISAMCAGTRYSAFRTIRDLYASRIFRDFNLVSGILPGCYVPRHNQASGPGTSSHTRSLAGSILLGPGLGFRYTRGSLFTATSFMAWPNRAPGTPAALASGRPDAGPPPPQVRSETP